MTVYCAFKGHIQRANICQGEAKSFFRTAKGVLWPLCQACADKHKQLVLGATKEGNIRLENLAGAVFDIPLDDTESLTAYQAQDPDKIRRIIQTVDDAVESPYGQRKDHE